MSTPDLLREPAFALPQSEKEPRLLAELNALTARHRERCPAYARLLDIVYRGPGPAASLADVPCLPVGLFKSHRLVSVPESEIVQTLTSSGTTGQQPSRIFLDQETANLQSAALVRILGAVLGPKRLPMIVVDTEDLLRNRAVFSARGAGVLGMLKFGAHPVFALDSEMRLDRERVEAFLLRFGKQPFLIFGFTFMVWRYFYEPLREAGLDLSQGVLIHSGGWKKLQEAAVDNDVFKASLKAATGLARVHNFYGMVEQTGSVFLEGPDGLLHAPAFADVIVRDPVTWREAAHGQVGVIQVLSALPRSYPGHALLTEDLGIVHGVDSTGGWLGKAFSVVGRVPRAELRGCSDAHAFSQPESAP
jgi:hypothetical protein